MKGLLLKDFYMSMRYCRSVLIIVAVFFLLSLSPDGNLFFMLYPLILAGAIPMSLIAYEERDNWTTYSGTLPYSRAQLVCTKYLMGLICGLLTCCLSMIGITLRTLPDGQIAQVFAQGMMLLALSLVSPAVTLPFIFKWGPEKGRILFYVVLVGVSGLSGAVASIGQIPETLTVSLAAGAAALGVMALVFALSYRLSVLFYRKREL